jgi:hypothetical protein
MKIKVGHKIYDSEKEPIVLILTEKDKENIKKMPPCCNNYLRFPDD